MVSRRLVRDDNQRSSYGIPGYTSFTLRQILCIGGVRHRGKISTEEVGKDACREPQVRRRRRRCPSPAHRQRSVFRLTPWLRHPSRLAL